MLFQLVCVFLIGQSGRIDMLFQISLSFVLRINKVKQPVDPRRRPRLVDGHCLLTLDFDLCRVVRHGQLLVLALQTIKQSKVVIHLIA